MLYVCRFTQGSVQYQFRRVRAGTRSLLQWTRSHDLLGLWGKKMKPTEPSFELGGTL
jgi:hypothetical protein